MASGYQACSQGHQDRYRDEHRCLDHDRKRKVNWPTFLQCNSDPTNACLCIILYYITAELFHQPIMILLFVTTSILHIFFHPLQHQHSCHLFLLLHIPFLALFPLPPSNVASSAAASMCVLTRIIHLTQYSHVISTEVLLESVTERLQKWKTL